MASTVSLVAGCLCSRRRSKNEIMESVVQQIQKRLRNLTETYALEDAEAVDMPCPCNQEIEVYHGSLQYWITPNYPEPYRDDITCNLTVTIPKSSSRIQAEVKVVGEGAIFQSSDHSCGTGDYLLVHTDHDSYVCGNLTGKSWLVEAVNEPRTFTYSFVSTSDDGGTGTGFMLSVEGFVFVEG